MHPIPITEIQRMNDKTKPKDSPLSRKVESNGKSIEVLIYSNGDGKWILEAVDEFNGSTVWEDPFLTDQAALDELNDTIKTDGIECLIGHSQ